MPCRMKVLHGVTSVAFVGCRYLDRIIRSSELHDFSEMLQLHQKALTADGPFIVLFQ